jgi:DNA-binding response OmpR family regulator
MPNGKGQCAAAMKKIIIAHELHALLERNETFLHRTGMTEFIAATNEEILSLHRDRRADLIISLLDMPGMSSEQLCSLIRADEDLRAVSIIMVCANTPAAIERSAQCRVNAVLLQPVHPLVLTVKAQQLLDIAARGTLRVLLSANIDFHAGDESFFCRSRNISATGMLIETDKLLTAGDRMSCLFYLPSARKIEVSGKIVRALPRTPGDEDYQYGFMFTDITPETRQVLIDFVGKSSHK